MHHSLLSARFTSFAGFNTSEEVAWMDSLMSNAPKEDMWRMHLQKIGMQVNTPQPTTRELYKEFFKTTGPVHLCKAVYTSPPDPFQVDYAIRSLECIVCGALSCNLADDANANFKPYDSRTFFGNKRASSLARGWCSDVSNVNNHLIVNTSHDDHNATQIV